VLDFDIYYDDALGTNVFTLLQANVVTEYYITTIQLDVGQTYSFKVTARNTVGSGP